MNRPEPLEGDRALTGAGIRREDEEGEEENETSHTSILHPTPSRITPVPVREEQTRGDGEAWAGCEGRPKSESEHMRA